MMKKYFLIAVVALMSAVTLNAQSVYIKNQRVEVRNNMLTINFDVNVNNMSIKSNEGLILTPVLQSNSKAAELPQIIINGRDRNIAYYRDRERLAVKPFMVVKREKKGTTLVEYRMNIPFEIWMEGASLILNEEVYGCLNSVISVSNNIIAANISSPKPIQVPVVVAPTVTETQPMVERLDSLVAVIYFKDNIANIDPDYSSNRANISKIDNALKDKTIRVASIKIVGSASPQGKPQPNEILSKERAMALSGHLTTNLNIPSQTIKTYWVGANWNTLKQLVSQSNMEYKQQVLNIITNVGIFSGRETDLMNLEAGKPYNYMKINFFPELRRVTCTIYYEEL